MIALISHANKIMLKILQARFQQYINWESQRFGHDLVTEQQPQFIFIDFFGLFPSFSLLMRTLFYSKSKSKDNSTVLYLLVHLCIYIYIQIQLLSFTNVRPKMQLKWIWEKTFHIEETTLMFIKDCSLIHVVIHSCFLSVIPWFFSHLFIQRLWSTQYRKLYWSLQLKNIDLLAMSTNIS